MDSFSDEIVMYVIKNKDNTITLTDDGWTLANLESKGVTISRSKNRKKIFTERLNAFGINEIDEELTTTVKYKDFPLAKNRLLQAILAVNDMFMLSKNNTKSLFFEDVGVFLEENNIRATPDVSIPGSSGITFNFDYLISGYKDIPTRFIKTISTPNNPLFAKAALTDILQTRELRKNSSFYVFLNDSSSDDKIITIKPEIKELLIEQNIKPVLFTERNSVLDELAA
nr:DUF1828 domain-containing protein [Lactobacillus colini]